VGSLLNHYIIELITAMTNTNLKLRGIAQQIFTDICEIMRVKFKAVNQLFTIILVGLAGNKTQTQSATIRSLIYTIKQNVQFSNSTGQELISAADPGFQQFLVKAVKIVVIFMRNRATPHELARSVMQFIKIAISLLSEELLKGEIAKLVIDSLFQSRHSPHVKKHKLLVRKILTRLIKRCGVAAATRMMPDYHRAMITYIEKQKRKSENKKQKDKLIALMGG